MRRILGRCMVFAWAISATLPAAAQLADQLPPELEEVGIEEHLDAKLPLNLKFRDENGTVVTLGDYFDGERPVILTLNYYKCPMLCGLQLNGRLDGRMDLDWTPGQEFEMVTVSINPLETPALATDKKQNYMKRFGRPSAAKGWHFLTGSEPEIRQLASTVGFGYTYDRETGEYAHAAAIFLITPDGRIARYLYGIEYPQRRLRLALMEASAGEIGTTIDQLILYCYHYDPSSRRYSPVAMNIMRLGGGATVLVLGLTLGGYWLREARRRKKSDRGTPAT
ncbi:MAG: SCO family protein [Candidatus Aminicenantes bacterium]|nr:MAG: SCO family protein [Candidatus Aminicenantes bacterium]